MGELKDHWVPLIAFDLARINGQVHVMQKGLRFIKNGIPDEEVPFVSIAVASNYDEAVKIVQSLREAAKAQQ